ncbi:MAG: hypothetical protein ACR2LV_10485 [Solirubrobacteraceae bacterium]
MPNPGRELTFPVTFTPTRFAEDLQHARPEGRRIAEQARQELERDGVSAALLAKCRSDHRDGTDLSGMVKLYLPMPYGPWGLVLLGAGGATDPHLVVVAFGERHPARRPSVYDVAHYRRHGSWPAGMTHRPR